MFSLSGVYIYVVHPVTWIFLIIPKRTIRLSLRIKDCVEDIASKASFSQEQIFHGPLEDPERKFAQKTPLQVPKRCY